MSGRPHALDEVKQAEVCALISSGVSLCSAARYVGCDRGTIRREQLRNEKFATQLRQAVMRAEFEPLAAMHKAVHRHWRAAAWLLERTRPGQYSRAAARETANLVRLETVHDLVGRFLELMAEELTPLAHGESAYRRLKRAIQENCRELTAAATVNRDPKRLRQVIAGMSVDFKHDETPEIIRMADVQPAAKVAAPAKAEVLQNTLVAAK